MKIAIVGAGISGLATAFYLKRARPEWELVIFEPGLRPGGTMRTVSVDGFLFEAGGNGFLTNKPDSLELVEASGARELLIPSSDQARRRFIFSRGQLHPLPESPPMFLKTGLINWRDKLRVAAEVLLPRRRDTGDETLQEFGYRRVGKAFTDVFLDAMVAGIYATTPDRISVQAAFPLVVALESEYGGLFRGMLAKRKREAGPGGILMSFRGGVSMFIEHLRQQIDADWRLGEPVRGIERQGDSYLLQADSGVTEADQVVLCAPAPEAAGILRELDGDVSRALASIDYSPIAVVGLGYRSPVHPLDGFGLLTTTDSRQPILGVLWDSSIFADRAPGGGKAVRVMLGGQRNPEFVAGDDETLLAMAREGLRSTMQLDREPDTVFIQRWERGIPSYPSGHLARVSDLFAKVAAHPGLHLNCNAYRGIAMNDCVRNSRELAGRIAAGNGSTAA